MCGNIMAFYLGLTLNIFKPRRRLVNVGEVVFLNDGVPEKVKVTCFLDTGTLFIDGKFAPAHLTIGESLNWFLGETITDIDIEELYFDNSKVNGERAAHAWEKRTFLLSHWKQYARHNIQIRLVIRLGDSESDYDSGENESVYLSIREEQSQDEPTPLIIQPFS
jgi:hypothetical protein